MVVSLKDYIEHYADGRVQDFLSEMFKNYTVLFVGFQGEGTLGRRLKEGATTVNILGEAVMRRAEVAALDGYSAHADRRELLDWAGSLKPRPRTVFLVHGEPGPMEVLASALRERLGVTVHTPSLGQEFELWN